MLKVADTPGPAQRSRCHPWLAGFFAFGAMMCALVLALLLFPCSSFDSVWRLNPEARLAFRSLGNWSFLLMLTVGIACLFAAIGLWRDTVWGTRLALTILSINLIGDLANALFRHDYRALIGLPVGAVMIFYLVRSGDWSKGFRGRTKGE
ncbi:MAG: DUF2127 domain-containing protein [Candidatus Udaeobacter sp.]